MTILKDQAAASSQFDFDKYISEHKKKSIDPTSIYPPLNETDVKYADTLNEATMSLEYFRQSQEKKAENDGQELENYNSPDTYEYQVASLAYDAVSNFNEMPEIAELNRQKIFKDAYDCVAYDYYDQASERSQKYFKLITSGQVLFLNNDDFQTFTNSYTDEIINHSSYAMTLKKGLILFNQELIMNEILNQELINIYHLIKRENFSLPKNQKEMINLIAEYIPFHYKITDQAIDPHFIDKQQTNDELHKMMLEEMLWSVAYHECLHVLSGNGQFRAGLDEAATYYYTALATFREKGVNAFGISIVLAGTRPSINWLAFIRDFGINQELAKEMYFNKNDQWSLENMLNFFADKREEFIKIMNWEEDDL